MKNRLFGLDLFRAAAILMVLMANTIFFFQLQLPALSDLAPMIGFVGLEAFLVLSGFLLARSLYPIFTTSDFDLRDAVAVIKRKMLRIVPLYWLALVANIAIAAAIGYPFDQAWKYFLFVQNFASPIPAFFPESWGLPVIVFAGLAFVLLLFGLSRIFSSQWRSAAFAAGTVMVLFIFVWTKWLYQSVHGATDLTQWETGLRTVTIYRIDSIMIGVLMGWFCMWRPQLSQRLRWLLFAAGLCGLLFLTVGVGYLQLLISDYPVFWNVWYLPLASVILACLLPLASSWADVPRQLGLVTSLSAMSYGIYLTHFSIVLLSMEHWLLRDAEVGGNTGILSLAYFAVAITVGWIFFQVEKRIFHRLNR